MRTAMDDDIAVGGYLHWSLLDNYEWGSCTPIFGLIAVERATFSPTPHPSLAWLGRQNPTWTIRRFSIPPETLCATATFRGNGDCGN